MKKNLFYLTLLLLGLFGCKKDDPVTPTDGTNYKSNILGIVLDESNNPVENATVNYGGVIRTTDKNGIYQYKDVNVNSKHSFVTIQKNGYFEAGRSFNTQKSASIKLINKLLKKTFSYAIPSATGGQIASKNFQLKFPADAVVIESTGAEYTGDIRVAVKHLEPDNFDTYDQMPGNLTGLNSTNDVQLLTTYGMLYVELQSTTNQKLQIKPGKEVEIKVTLSPAVLADAPATVPMWFFDDASGYWKEEGSAALINGAYIANVSHFSCWNYDSSQPTINVSGKVVDANGNPVECHIGFWQGSNGGGHGNTNSDGTYSGPVTKGVVLNLRIYTYNGSCANQIIYTEQVGPFSTDVVLPDITVSPGTEEFFSITGNFKDCNGNAVQSGYVKVSEGGTNHYYDIVNGSVNGTYLTCINPITATLVAIDEINVKESDPINLIGAGVHNLGTVDICASVPDHITIKNPNLNIDQINFEFEIYIDSVNHKQLYTTFKNGDKIGGFSFSWGDPNSTGYTIGTFPITQGYAYTTDPYEYFTFKSGSINVTEAGSFGDNLVATYTMTMQKFNTTDLETFTGDLKWKIQ